jgi:hypothetical protein
VDRIRVAIDRARVLGDERVPLPIPRGSSPARWFAMGDPQASLERFFAVLDRAGLLADDGRLRDDVGLLSIGDHFDYGKNAEEAARDGIALLHWLAMHPPDQVVMLAGNHDISRVTELAHETDESFAAARSIVGVDAELHRRFPRITTRELAERDYSGFTESQRQSVQTLLMARRFSLAATATIDSKGESAGVLPAHRPIEGAPALFVHAGFTERERAMLQVTIDARAIAHALDRFLDERVARVAPAWTSGALAPLDLEPLHLGGVSGIEGGGFLYHRPADPDRKAKHDSAWEENVERPRRYDPRRLPRGLVQAVGHTSHKKCLKELDPWITARAREIENGGLRTLRVGAEVVYDVGIAPPSAGEAVVYMIDSSMSDATVSEIPLLPIGTPTAGRGAR